MKVQTVKFPQTPEATLEEIHSLRGLLDKYHMEQFGTADVLPSEMLAIMWHSAQIDFIEALNDADERVGLVMVSIYSKVDGTRGANVMAAYVEEDYRSQGVFKQMLSLAKVVYRARNILTLDLTVPLQVDASWFGKEHTKTYRLEL